MVEESDALARILAATQPLEGMEVPLLQALECFVANPIRASLSHPRFDNSVVDGYAIRVEDGASARKIQGEQPAGRDLHLQLGKMEAIRIFTGAPIPQNATAVVMQEDVAVENGRLILRETVELGENIRRKGADLSAGQLIARQGAQITPQMVGLLASQGSATVKVHRRPTVTILSTGDELRPAGASLAEGEIYDSNGLMLAALLHPLGIQAELRHCPDDPTQTRSEIACALEKSDVLIISGGVSVGDHDHVKPALAALGISLDLWRIRMKPGKPLAFATHQGKLIFGLPGNPVASFVTFLVLVRPALRQLMGAEGADRFLESRKVHLASDISNSGERPHYLRGTVHDDLFICQKFQESHAIYALSGSNALLRVEPGVTLSAGDEQQVLKW